MNGSKWFQTSIHRQTHLPYMIARTLLVRYAEQRIRGDLCMTMKFARMARF